jgi:hypothetical protein
MRKLEGAFVFEQDEINKSAHKAAKAIGAAMRVVADRGD